VLRDAESSQQQCERVAGFFNFLRRSWQAAAALANSVGCLPTTVALVATLTRYIDGARGHRHPQPGLSWLLEKTTNHMRAFPACAR